MIAANIIIITLSVTIKENMNGKELGDAIKIDWFDPRDEKDRADVLKLLADLTVYVSADIIKQVYTEWLNKYNQPAEREYENRTISNIA